MKINNYAKCPKCSGVIVKRVVVNEGDTVKFTMRVKSKFDLKTRALKGEVVGFVNVTHLIIKAGRTKYTVVAGNVKTLKSLTSVTIGKTHECNCEDL